MLPELTEFEQAIVANLPDDWTIAPGVSPTCPECQSAWGMSPREFYAAYERGAICEEGSFSRQSCDSCGSDLAGDRHDAHAISKIGIPNPEVLHISICTDCLCYHANGDLPETWE